MIDVTLQMIQITSNLHLLALCYDIGPGSLWLHNYLKQMHHLSLFDVDSETLPS